MGSDAHTTVVIGAARGIGRAVAVRLAAEPGCERIVLADVDAEGLAGAAAELADGPAVEQRTLDLTDGDQVRALADAAGDAERLAIVAGVFLAAPSLETTREDFERILAVNLTGVFLAAQAHAERMVARGGGSIVAVASIAARMPRMRQAAYCASKAGMRQALRVLGMEVAGAGVRVNFVSPGPTDTPMMRALAKDHASVDDLAAGSPEALRPPIPRGRVARPGDIAEGVAFLLSPASGHVTLQDLVVDGGELLGC